MKKIIIAGGSGTLGKVLGNYFSDEGYRVVILTRRAKQPIGNISFMRWDGESLGNWASEVNDAEAVINLNGRTVNCRYTKKNKKDIIDTRVNSTSIIGKAIGQCTNPPKVWINASSAAIYGNTGDKITDENSPYGKGFSTEVCIKWENALNTANIPHTRKIALRIGLVLTEDGGVLQPIFNLAKYGLAGTIGNGKQYMSWLHEDDFIRVINLCLNDEKLTGAFNCTCPNPVTNAQFMKAVRKASGSKIGFPAPALFVKIGAFFMGTEPELVLKGRRVVSKVLEEKNFQFKFKDIDEAMNDIVNRRAGNIPGNE